MSTKRWPRRLVRSTPDSERSIAKTLPVSSRSQIASAPNPGPAADLQDVVRGLDVHQVDRPSDPWGDGLQRHAHRLPDGRRGVRHRRAGRLARRDQGGRARRARPGRHRGVPRGRGRRRDGARGGDRRRRRHRRAGDRRAPRRSSTSPIPTWSWTTSSSASTTASTPSSAPPASTTAGSTTLRGWLADAPDDRRADRPQLLDRRDLDDALRGRGGAVLRVRRGRRAPPPDQGGRSLRHGTSYGGADRRRPPRGRPRPGARRDQHRPRGGPRRRRRRRPGARPAGPRPGRPPGGPPRRSRGRP